MLADYDAVFHSLARDKLDQTTASSTVAMSGLNPLHTEIDSACVAMRQRSLFTIACKDFFDRLNSEQKDSFRDIFSNLQESEICEMLKAL